MTCRQHIKPAHHAPAAKSSDFPTIRARYLQDHGFSLLRIDASGRVVEGDHDTSDHDCDCGLRSDTRRLQVVEQTRYWGDTIIQLCCDSGTAMWGVPILDNNILSGALLVQGVELEDQTGAFHQSVQIAADALLQVALEHNLINQAEVMLARQRTVKEQDRFLAIEATKDDLVSDDMRSIYLSEEPSLLGAIKQGDIKQARSILNRVLIGIYGLAGDRMELLKSSVLELIVMMSRAAVEAGAEPSAVLGSNYRSLVELSKIDDEEDLSDWVRRMLETLIEGIRTNNDYPHTLLLMKAVKHMQANLHEHLRRDEVARIAGVSPSHFSKLVTDRMGRSFTQLLTQMRVNHAKELLTQSKHNLTEIAIECGFFDQSHFTKVFRAATSYSPGEYRKREK